DGFGYVKFDYNETLGLGVDGAESPGEGLRQVILATNELYAGLAKVLPNTVIELCASGGHRLEPSLMRHGHMGSFSDAHETPELPLIAAGLHRLVPVRQLQVWAVLRVEADERRLLYVLAAGFLGRMCLSGDLPALSEEQWSLAKRALELYAKAAPVLRDGRTHWFGPAVKAWRHPEGWQLIVRVAADEQTALVVGHAFGGVLPEVAECELPGGPWVVEEMLAETATAAGATTGGSASPLPGAGAGANGAATLTETAAFTLVGGRRLVWGVPGAFSAAVVLLRRA
ncbi:MAG: alpha-galactosidase, partial [Opitutaceae bacterium]|nr:alpha-galactosidase [Opitutaceae bacterium]